MGFFLYITWKVSEDNAEEHLKLLETAIRQERDNYPEIKSLRLYRKLFGPHGGLLGGPTLSVVEILEFESMGAYEKWVPKSKKDRKFLETYSRLKGTMVDGSYSIHTMTDILKGSWTER